MSKRQTLAAIAFGSLVATSIIPMEGQAVITNFSTETYIAKKGCGEKCGGSTPDNSTSTDSSATNDQGNSKHQKPQEKSGHVTTDPNKLYTDSYDSYNTNRNSNTSPSYREMTAPSFNGANTNMNRNYNTASDYDYNRPLPTTTAVGGRMTEGQLWSALSPQARDMYLKLDPEWRAKALDLASQDSYRDKDLAIKEAQRRMIEQRGGNLR